MNITSMMTLWIMKFMETDISMMIECTIGIIDPLIGGITEVIIPQDITVIHSVIDTEDVKILFGGCFGPYFLCKNGTLCVPNLF